MTATLLPHQQVAEHLADHQHPPLDADQRAAFIRGYHDGWCGRVPPLSQRPPVPLRFAYEHGVDRAQAERRAQAAIVKPKLQWWEKYS